MSPQEYYLSNTAMSIRDQDDHSFKGSLRTRFFPFCLTDPAPLQTFVLMAASHYSISLGPQSHSIDLGELRVMAMREITGALNDPGRATSDQLIAAVANMAWYEALFGDRKIFNIHMTGLLRMVSIRGGLPALGLDGFLERVLLWIDRKTAHITASPICFDKAASPPEDEHLTLDSHRFANGLHR